MKAACARPRSAAGLCLVAGMSAGMAACYGELPDPEPMAELVVGDEPPEAVQPDMLTVIDTISFARETVAGVSPGFDVDGVVSMEGGDPASCGAYDFTSPQGTPGVDNQVALIAPLFDLVGIGAIDSFIQGAVEEGGLLLMWQIDGMEDPVDDDEVELMMRFGSGTPLLGTDGRLLAGQTFHLHVDSTDQVVPNARIEDGVLTAGPFDTKLPITVFDVFYELTVQHARLRAELTYDGGLVTGVLGGAVPLSSIMDIAIQAEAEAGGILEAVEGLLQDIGDLAPDETGTCQEMSAALVFTAVSAFFYPEDGE